MIFRLTIELGNAAMQDMRDVSIALERTAGAIRADDYPTEGIIRDTNGNTVGRFAVEEA